MFFKKEDLDTDYIGKYKHQKAFSRFDSGFVGHIKVYEFSTKRIQYVLFAMSDLHKVSMKVNIYGFYLKKLPNQILIFYQHGALIWPGLINLVIMLLLHYIN